MALTSQLKKTSSSYLQSYLDNGLVKGVIILRHTLLINSWQQDAGMREAKIQLQHDIPGPCKGHSNPKGIRLVYLVK